MFVVDKIIVSDEVVSNSFCCNLTQCLGACCIHGDEGAPLEPEERQILESNLPTLIKYLTPEALAVIETEGVWEEVAPGHFATTCIDGEACVFVMYEQGIAKCAIQHAYQQGEVTWEKPLSCHLYPIRIHNYGGHEVLNFDENELCVPAKVFGKSLNLKLYNFLKEPLIRKYGEAWYQAFQEACIKREAELK